MPDPRLDHIEDQLIAKLPGYERYAPAAQPLAPPTGLRVTVIAGQAGLFWDAVPDATGYAAISVDAAGNSSPPIVTTDLSVVFAGLSPGAYTFAVQSTRDAAASDWAKVTGTVPGVTPTPTPPPDVVGPVTPIPANAPRVDPGADIAKVASGSVLRAGQYVTSGHPKPGMVLYAEGPAFVMLKNGQQFGTKAIGNLKLINLGFEGGASSSNVGNDGASVVLGDNCYLEGVTVRKSAAVGIDFEGNDSTSVRLLVEDCAGSGRGGNSPHRYHEIGAIVRRCNHVLKDHNGGGGKILKGYGIIIEGGQFYDNCGSGIWFDWDAQGLIFRNNKMWGQVHWSKSGANFDVYGTGRDFYIEGNIKGPFLIEGNQFLGSEGGRIEIAESAHGTIRGNTFLLPPPGPSTRRMAAIVFRNINRKGLDDKMGGNYLQDISITGNTFADGMQIIGGDGGQNVTLSKNHITIAGNSGNVVVKISN